MGNFNTPALLFGFILLVASIILFLFGRFKPELQRDSDNIYAVVGIVCALILFASAFSLSLGMSFQQLLMIGSLITLMWENIQNRQPKAPGSRRGTFDDMRDGMRQWGNSRRGRPRMEDERAVSNIYRYESERDSYDRFDDPRRRDQRRIRGSEPRSGYGDEFGAEPRRDRPDQGSRSSMQDSDSRRGRGGYDDFGDRPNRGGRGDGWDEPARRPSGRGDGRGPGGDRRPPQGDMPPPRRRPPAGSMDGSPIPTEMRESRSGRDFNDAADQPGPGNRPPMETSNRPPTDRPPTDRPLADRPPADRPPMDRPPVNRPPMEAGNRPPMDRPPMDRPPMDRPPTDRPPINRPPVNAGPASQASPARRPADDDYVDFKPLTSPPDDEMDNSSQFDD